jgi:Pyruvate/2-oxoacid:ferredoxin oxidoreductase delta subunit
VDGRIGKGENYMDEIYVKLRDRLNELAFGYGATENGAEFALLERFFTPEDAKHVLEMEVDKFFTPGEYAQVSGMPEEEAERVLDDLSMRGLIYRKRGQGDKKTYRVVPIAHGVIEFNVDEVVRDLEEGKAQWLEQNGKHTNEVWGKQWFGSTEIPFFRSVPVNTEVVSKGEVLPGDDAQAIIRSKKIFAVSKCLCRIETAAAGGFDDPRKEVCLAFDDMAQFYIDVGIGRRITMEEAIDIVEESIRLGLCIHVANSKESEVMCSCNVDRCGLLQMTKAFGGAATAHVSHYRIAVDENKCRACGVCVEKCPTECCYINEKKISACEAERCIGCGQCVIHCPSKARSLVRKSEDEILELQNTIFDTYEKMEVLRKESGEIKG